MRRSVLLFPSFAVLSVGANTCNLFEHRCQNGGICVKTTDQVTGADRSGCTCPAGFSGARCETAGACDLKCQHGGSCRPRPIGVPGTSDFVCECLGPYKGTECEIPVEICPVSAGGVEECEWGGTCRADEDGKFRCDCPSDRFGSACEVKVTQVNNPSQTCDLTCQNGGSCLPRNGDGEGFFCKCVGPYKGKECQIPVATCPVNGGQGGGATECLWGGTCVADEDSGQFRCECPSDRFGPSCEVRATVTDVETPGSSDKVLGVEDGPDGVTRIVGTCLHDAACTNGGLCLREHDAAATAATGTPTKRTHCLCVADWGGNTCDKLCLTRHCQNGASCRFYTEDFPGMTGNTPYCACDRDRFKGSDCEIAVAKCPGIGGVECLYGGVCAAVMDYAGFYTCDCPAGRKGAQCEDRDPAYLEQTLLVPKEDLDPTVFVISIVTVALFVFLPLTVAIVWRGTRQEREVQMQSFAAEECNGKDTAHKSGREVSINGAVLPKDAQVI